MSSERRDIEQRRRDWVSAVNERDVDAYLDVLAEDIVWLPPGQTAIEGHAAFAEWVGPFFKSYEYEFVLEDVVVRTAGDRAVERGRFATSMTSTDTGKSMTHEGRYLALWRRDKGGRWVIERYMDGAYLKD